MHTGPYHLSYAGPYDRAGEGAAGPAPRQRRTRTHPQRFTTTVSRPGHQPHGHGPALRGGRGVQAHALPALRGQGRVDRRTSTTIRSGRPARGVRARRPHATRTAARRLRHRLAVCPFIAAAVEIHDPGHPARAYARAYEQAVAGRFTETARAAGATNPAQLGEELALLLDGAAARGRGLNTSSFSIAAAVGAVLIDNAIPSAAVPPNSAARRNPRRSSR